MSDKYKFFLILIFSLFLVFPVTTSAVSYSELSCDDVEGLSVFGFDSHDDVYKFIGAISNEYNSKSIANEYGAGSEYKSNSIFNEYGNFGSKYSSYSAFNDYASYPPILINKENYFVGYLTLNTYKTPYVNPWVAYSCAKKTYSSSISDHEDLLFSKIPESSSDNSLSSTELLYLYSLLKKDSSSSVSCPANATPNSTGSCVCDNGFVAVGNECKTYTNACQITYGVNSYGDKDYCYCKSGYHFSKSKSCVKDTVVKESISYIVPLDTKKVYLFSSPKNLKINRIRTFNKGEKIQFVKDYNKFWYIGKDGKNDVYIRKIHSKLESK